MMNETPNIIFIMADDHAANAISLYKSRLASVFKTPNLDRIGQEGAILNNCHCTNAICTPSRATILTGQYSHTNGVKTLRDRLPISSNTYPKLLQNNGYQTAVVGKWHVHSEPQGFDYYDILPDQGLYFDPYFVNALTLSQQANIYAYDAYFLDCAIRHNSPLLTLDRKLMESAQNLNIEILEV